LAADRNYPGFPISLEDSSARMTEISDGFKCTLYLIIYKKIPELLFSNAFLNFCAYITQDIRSTRSYRFADLACLIQYLSAKIARILTQFPLV
jgi:hypothetical protein